MVRLLELLLPLTRWLLPRAHEAGVLGHRDGEAPNGVLAERKLALWLLVILRLGATPRGRAHGELARWDRAGRADNHFFVMQPSLLIAQTAQSLRQVCGDERPMRAGDMLVLGRQLGGGVHRAFDVGV